MNEAKENLIAAWRALQTSRSPYILDADRRILDPWDEKRTRKKSQSVYYPAQDWSQFTQSTDFGAPDDSRLHAALLPMPFIGNLSEAKIFILMLNPGFGPHDYFGEYNVPEYKEALLANLRQAEQPNGFLFLDPQFSWHGGYRYWHNKVQKLITAFAERREISFDEPRRAIQRTIASVELVPYHSAKFSMPKSVRRSLASAKLARAFAMEVATRPECLVIVARKSREWNLTELDGATNVVEYSGSDARAAHLTPKSPGGRRILAFLEQA